MIFYRRNIVILLFLMLLSNFSVAGVYLSPNITKIKISTDTECYVVLAVKNIDIENIKSVSVLNDGLPLDYIDNSDDYEKVIRIDSCDNSKVLTKVTLNNETVVEKSIRLTEPQKKYGFIAKKSLKSTAKKLRSDDFLRVTVKMEDWGIPSSWVRSLRTHRHGLADKLDELSSYTDRYESLIKDQVTGYLMSLGVPRTSAEGVSWALVNIIL